MNFNIFPTELILQKYHLFWQYPVITEKEFFNQNKNEPLYCGFPWATIIDKQVNLNDLYHYFIPFLKHKNYYTCCQHIHFKSLISFFNLIGINCVYSPHKILNENFINNIKIIPCPLYGVNIENNNNNNYFKNINFLNIERPLLYSFIGGYQDNYISNIRPNIFKIKNNKYISYIENTKKWHFNNIVYNNSQNFNNDINIDNNYINNTNKFNYILSKTRFSLCPSGSGPNSIRFWESLAIGSIPVLLSDSLELPYNIEWKNAIVIIKEYDIYNIESILKNISKEKELKMRKNCIEIYNNLKNNYKNNIKTSFKNIAFTNDNFLINELKIQNILKQWCFLNPNFEIVYFSNFEIETFLNIKYSNIMLDDFKKIYIKNSGGFWFDLNETPIKFKKNK